MNVTRIIFVRHGQTEWNVQDRWQGQGDSPLTELGLQQAKTVAQSLGAMKNDIAAIYSSDLQRAHLTAQEIGMVCGKSVILSSALREFALGQAEGMTKKEYHEKYGASEAELDKQYQNRADRWNHTSVPGAELKNIGLSRLKNFLNEIVAFHQGQTIVIVSHGMLLNGFIIDIAQVNQKPSNCGIAEFTYDPTKEESKGYKFEGIRDL